MNLDTGYVKLKLLTVTEILFIKVALSNLQVRKLLPIFVIILELVSQVPVSKMHQEILRSG